MPAFVSQKWIARELAEIARRASVGSLLEFIPKTTPRWESPVHLKPYTDVLEAFPGGDLRVVFAAPPQHGKDLADRTPIETSRGWTTVGDVRVGDELVGRDGRWTRVLGVYPQHVDSNLFEVEFGDGEVITAGASHRWSATTPAGRSWKTQTTRGMFLRGKQAGFFRIPVVGDDSKKRRIRSIRPVPWEPATCFEVDASDHLFCAGRTHVVSHNSETAMHAFPWWLLNFPYLRFLYITYGQDRADRVEIKARAVAQRAGLVFRKRKNVWVTPQGGGVIWTSMTGQITGEPVDGGVLIDDPYKDMIEAESQRNRQVISDAMDMVIDTRLHRGASVVCMATRWHPQDLSGKLIRDGYKYINLKAIADGPRPEGDNRRQGEALWPRRKTVEDLEKIRKKKPFVFASMYQGEPRPRAGKLFKGPHFYDRLPDLDVGFRVIYGMDLSYTKKTKSDWSVLIRFRVVGDVMYVTNLWRYQIQAPDFGGIAKTQQEHFPGTVFFYCAGPEIGSVDYMRRAGVNVVHMPAKLDKYARSIDTADAWNTGRILLPSPDSEYHGDWVSEFFQEVEDFTGIDGATDDQVDALVSGHDGMSKYGSGDYEEEYNDYLPEMRM